MTELEPSREITLPNRFEIKTITRTNDGVELGPYRQDVIDMMGLLFPGMAVSPVEVVEDATTNSWEAVIIALDGTKAIGFGSIGHLDDGVMWMRTAYVREEYRRKGIYTQLLQERIEFARKKGAKSVKIHTLDNAMSLKNRHGFTAIYESDPHSGIYTKELC